MRVGVPHGLRGIAPRAGVAGDAGVGLSSLCVVVVFGRGGCVFVVVCVWWGYLGRGSGVAVLLWACGVWLVWC